MKKIIYSPSVGDGTVVLHPSPAARLCCAVVLDKEIIEFEAMPLSAAQQQWPQSVDFIFGETEDEFVDRIWAKDVPPDAVNARLIDAADIPSDRSFRDAWRHGKEGVVMVDMDIAIEVHKTRLRAARAPMLAALDVEYQRADEAADPIAKASIVERKQQLRDITKLRRLTEAKSVDELLSVSL